MLAEADAPGQHDFDHHASPVPLHVRRQHMWHMQQAAAEAKSAEIAAHKAAQHKIFAKHIDAVATDEFAFNHLPAKQAREAETNNPWAVRYKDRYPLPSRERMEALEKRDRESAFDASLLRSQLRASEDLRHEGIMVPLASQSKTVADGLAEAAPGSNWRSQHYHDYMKILYSTGGPQPGMPRATNQVPNGAFEETRGSSNFRAKLAVGLRGSFNGQDSRIEDEAVPQARPARDMSNLLEGLQKATGLDMTTVNSLYLKLRVWAQASPEYSGVGSPHLTRIDFCTCMVRDGLATNMGVAGRFFLLFDTDNSGYIDASKFVQGWAKFGPSVPMEEKISTLVALFGVDEAGWLRIPETRDAVEFAYTITGHRGLTTIDDDICRLLVDTGTDDEGRINAKMLATIIKVPEWRSHFKHAFDDIFVAAVTDSGHGYPVQPFRTTFHDGRMGTAPVLGTPDKVWVCGPGGSLGYGGK